MGHTASNSLVDGGENTRRFDHVFCANRTPIDVARVALLEDSDGVTIDDKLAIFGLNISFEAAVDRVILEHINLNTSYDIIACTR
jgi:hypothetical protein